MDSGIDLFAAGLMPFRSGAIELQILLPVSSGKQGVPQTFTRQC